MQTEIKNIQEDISPPLPPAAVFDEQQVAAAKPVQPLPNPPLANPGWRNSLDRWHSFLNQRVIAVATMFAGAAICAAVATAPVDWFSTLPPAQDEGAQTVSESRPQSGTPLPASGSLIKKQIDAVREPREPRPRVLSNRRVREMPPVLEFNNDEGDAAGKTRPRLVSVIH